MKTQVILKKDDPFPMKNLVLKYAPSFCLKKTLLVWQPVLKEIL